MRRSRFLLWLLPLLAVLAVVGSLGSTQRARAAGGKPKAKPAASAMPVPIASVATKGTDPLNATKAGQLPASASASIQVAPVPVASASIVVAVPNAASGDGKASHEQKSAGGKEGVDLTTLPTGVGLPITVHMGVFVVAIQSFDDVKGEFEATTDLRMTWRDLRLAYPSKGEADLYVEYRGKEAEERLAKIWTPNIDVVNRIETTGYTGHRLREYADGEVEMIIRTNGRFKVEVDVQNFPFDVQKLKQIVVLREQTNDQVALHYDKDDEDFSRAASDAKIDSWEIGDIHLSSDEEVGWNGDRYARVTASLIVSRIPTTGITTIFIPLIASLLIPLLALWMNRTNPEGFEVEAFELANMAIGGLFSVIALSYAVSSSYSTVAGSDNTVTRLFALNYGTLAFSLAIVVLLFRFNFVLRLFGPYVHQQVYRFMLWAVPLLTFATSITFVLIAAC